MMSLILFWLKTKVKKMIQKVSRIMNKMTSFGDIGQIELLIYLALSFELFTGRSWQYYLYGCKRPGPN